MAEIVLETERLALRRWRDSDVDHWLEHLNTPQVRAYLGGPDSLDEVTEKFAKLKMAWDEQGFSFLAMELRKDGRFLGTCGLGRIVTECAPDELKDTVQIGWQLRAEEWRRGYATEAASAVLTLAFERFELPTVYAQTSERNRGSWRVMERIGMTRRAELDYDDPDYPAEDNPTMVWSLAREAWQAAQAGAEAHA